MNEISLDSLPDGSIADITHTKSNLLVDGENDNTIFNLNSSRSGNGNLLPKRNIEIELAELKEIDSIDYSDDDSIVN